MLKCITVVPVSEVMAEAAMRARPMPEVRCAPSREITQPVTKLGANMETTCHWMAVVASMLAWPQT